MQKIEEINDNIDSKTTRKSKVQNLRFKLKTVLEGKVKKVMSSIKKKKSAGLDGIGQGLLLLGADIVATPLTRLINNLIENRLFPEEWKKAVVTPILKKVTKNYRPVSCRAAASKVLEKIVCELITKHMKSNNMLPDSQNGFRGGRSTMTTLSELERD